MRYLLTSLLVVLAVTLRAGEIDKIIDKTLSQRGIEPSVAVGDDVFLRRTSILLTGLVPSAEQAAAFIGDKSPQKRVQLVDSLLSSEAYIFAQVNKWGDLLRIKAEFPSNLWPNATQAYNRWLKVQIRDNVPYDVWVRDLLTASGSNFRTPQVNFYRAFQTRTPQAFADNAALLFMGLRKAPQGIDEFFTEVKFKGSNEWKEEFVFVDLDARAPFPIYITMPDGKSVPIVQGKDSRVAFASWLTAKDNPLFARAIVNRVWSWLMGRGIVDPADDMSAQVSNPELLGYLEKDFVAHNFDLKYLFRQILLSDAYARSSVPNKSNAADTALFSHYTLERLSAETIVDGIADITGVGNRYISRTPEPYSYFPLDMRSVELGDGTVTSPELMLFGRPTRDVALESDRKNELNSMQVLYLVNSSTLAQKIAQSPKLKAFLQTKPTADAASEWLYLTVIGRYPSVAETAVVKSYMAQNGNAKGAADVMWALLNSKEFLFKH